MMLRLFLLLVFFIEIILECAIDLKSVWGGVSFKNIALLLMLALVFLGAGRPSKTIGSTERWIIIALIIWVSYAVLTTLFSAIIDSRLDFSFAFGMMKSELIDVFVTFFLFNRLIKNPREGTILLNLLILTVGAFAFLGVLDGTILKGALFGLDNDASRPNGPFGEPNQTAAVLAMCGPIALSLAMQGAKSKLVFGGVFICIAMAIVMTSSRGGIVALVLGLLFWLWLIRDKIKPLGKLGLLVSLPLLLITVWLLMPEHYQTLIISRFGFVSDKTINYEQASAGRTMLWSWGLDLFSQSPLLGNGWSAYKFIYHGATHNTYLDILVSTGVFGLLFYLGILFVIFRLFYRMANNKMIDPKKRILGVGFVAGLLSLYTALFFVNIYVPSIVVWALIAVCLCTTQFRMGNPALSGSAT